MTGNESHSYGDVSLTPDEVDLQLDLGGELDVDVCVIGAGPHGLAAAVQLLEAEPSLRLATIDLSGEWLSTWHSQMARACIETLRSPIVHSPSADPGALANHIHEHRLRGSGLRYDIPTVEAFEHFCKHLVASSEVEAPIRAEATRLIVEANGVRIETSGPTVSAGAVVIATNPHRRNIPDWVWPLLGQLPGLVSHADGVDLATLEGLGDEHVAIIGGGLSAAHLACGVVSRGGCAHLITRRPIEVRSFDTDPGWLGPKCLDEFEAERDPNARLEMARAARGGGTIPPWMSKRLDGLIDRGQLVLHESAEVRAASVLDDSRCRLALTDGHVVDARTVMLGTGTTPHISALRFLTDILADLPELDGYPLLDEKLRLGSHPIHIMGRLATLTLGPAAGNLWGAQRAARLITTSIVGEQRTAFDIAELAPEARNG